LTILKLLVAGITLFGLHGFLAAHGTPAGAHIITGAAAFLLAIIVGVTRESFV
jgi:hypothetical protein